MNPQGQSKQVKSSAVVKLAYYENGQLCQANSMYLQPDKMFQIQLDRMPGHYITVELDKVDKGEVPGYDQIQALISAARTEGAIAELERVIEAYENLHPSVVHPYYSELLKRVLELKEGNKERAGDEHTN